MAQPKVWGSGITPFLLDILIILYPNLKKMQYSETEKQRNLHRCKVHNMDIVPGKLFPGIFNIKK